MKAFCKVIGKVRSEAGLLESRTEIQGIVGTGGQKIFLRGQSVDKTKRKGVSVNANPLFLLVGRRHLNLLFIFLFLNDL